MQEQREHSVGGIGGGALWPASLHSTPQIFARTASPVAFMKVFAGTKP
jgi:hypothetical protein